MKFAFSMLLLLVAVACHAQDAAELHRRGEEHFRAGRMAEAIADFDRELELTPDDAPHHWQRGIAYYYAGEYEKGVKQFELHQTVNPQDVENAVWHFLCAVRAPGGSAEEARKALIPIERDTREPMAQVHQLFAGKMTPEEVIAAGKKAGGSAEFYADLYVGLYNEAIGKQEDSLRHIKLAAENPAALDSYMGDVARVHLKLRSEGTQQANWPGVGNDPGCMRYSELTQINRNNVAKLQQAWTYNTGELQGREGKTIECTPLVVDGVMYVTTAYLRVVAIDAATGKELWQFNPLKDHPSKYPLASGGVNRGCAYWSDGKPNGERRIIHGTSDGRLFSLDAKTGKLDPSFGDGGIRDLRKELDPSIVNLAYGPTSAPAIWEDTIILGVSCGEGPAISAPGDIRAFDVRTGAQLWLFHTVPQPGEFGHDTWQGDSWKNRGGANAWGGISVDAKRGLVFAGLGSAAFDFYGGDRHGENLLANCTIALDARTGKRVWHFQTLHHDLWDHDLPVYPNLVTVTHGGKQIDAVAQVTKTGFVYLFDRETGKPLFDIVEKPVPTSDIPGEQAWPTQPIPVKPPPFSTQFFDESNVTDIGPANRASVIEQLAKLRGGPAFNPPSLQGTVVIPGLHGGANWSGASFDPSSGMLYVNSNNVPNIISLAEEKNDRGPRYGIYNHGGYAQFRDNEGYPAIKPPWGELNAINLNTGEIAWQVPLGEYAELTARGIPPTGTETFGGTIVTAGGLVFIAGTKDEKIRAFDKQTGKVLWTHDLPAGGYATPSTYMVGSKQYVVIAAGGAGKLGTKAGDAFVAFALP